MTLLRVGIVGSRSRNAPKDKQLIRFVLEKQLEKGYTLHLVSGGCRKGADKFAEELSEELHLGISIHYPDIKPDCQRWEYALACYERNTLIANECDILLATWDGTSSGTFDTIKKTKSQNKPVVIL